MHLIYIFFVLEPHTVLFFFLIYQFSISHQKATGQKEVNHESRRDFEILFNFMVFTYFFKKMKCKI